MQLRQVGGIVLAVAIERADPFGARVAHAARNRRALPAAERMAQHAQLRESPHRGPRARRAAVSSVLPSSTNIISNALPASACAISRASGPTFSASLQTGTTTEISGVMRAAPSRRLARQCRTVASARLPSLSAALRVRRPHP